jgi:hypothetical protein
MSDGNEQPNSAKCGRCGGDLVEGKCYRKTMCRPAWQHVLWNAMAVAIGVAIPLAAGQPIGMGIFAAGALVAAYWVAEVRNDRKRERPLKGRQRHPKGSPQGGQFR